MAVHAGRKVTIQIDLNDDPEGTPNWVNIGGERDATFSRSTTSVDGTTKATQGWKLSIPTENEWTIGIEAAFDPLDPVLIELDRRQDLQLNMWLRINEQAIGGPQRYGEAIITSWEKSYPKADIVVVSIEFSGQGVLKPVAV